MERVIAYIDGFNLYHGLKEERLARYYWLDLTLLCNNFLIKPQELFLTKYFTARINAPEAKRLRQTTYLEALGTLDKLSIIYGRYDTKKIDCYRCHKTFDMPNEKMTDVNLAVEMLTDAFQDNFDTAYVISGDADLTPPITKVKQLFPRKKIITWFPPSRHSESLRRASDYSTTIGRAVLAKCLLPNDVTRSDGFKLTCSSSWK